MAKKEKAQPQALSRQGVSASDKGGVSEPIIAHPKAPVKCEKVPETHPLLLKFQELYVQDWKKEHPKDKQNRTNFRVSDVGQCPRKTFYEFHHADKKRDMAPSTIMMFTFGDLFHDEVQRVFERMGATARHFIEFGTLSKIGFEKRGRLDLFLHQSEIEGNMELTAICIMEIKSKNPYAFDVELPNPEEIDQVLSYVEDSKNDPYIKARWTVSNEAYIFYIDRSGMGSPIPIAMWRVTHSEERVKEIKSFFRTLHRLIKSGICPARPYAFNSIKCSYCRYRDLICWQGEAVPIEPKHEADETIPVPSQEIVDSIAGNFYHSYCEIKRLEKEMEFQEKVLTQYFKSTGNEQLIIGEGETAGRVYFHKGRDRILKLDYLKKHLAKFWLDIAKPTLASLEKLLSEGKIDGTTFERSIDYEPAEGVRVRMPRKKKEE